MTTIVYRTKFWLEKIFCFSLKYLDGDLTEDKKKCLGPALS